MQYIQRCGGSGLVHETNEITGTRFSGLHAHFIFSLSHVRLFAEAFLATMSTLMVWLLGSLKLS